MWNLNTVSVWPRSASLRVGWDSLPSWAAAEIVILATRMQRLSFLPPVPSSLLRQVPNVCFCCISFNKNPRETRFGWLGDKVVIEHWMFLRNKAKLALHSFCLGLELTSNILKKERGRGYMLGKHKENKPWISMEWDSFVPGFDKFMQISCGSQTGVHVGNCCPKCEPESNWGKIFTTFVWDAGYSHLNSDSKYKPRCNHDVQRVYNF